MTDNKNDISPDLLKSIVDHLPSTYMSVVDSKYKVVFSGGEEFRKLHLDPESFKGRGLEEIFGDQSAAVKKYYRKALKGEPQVFEMNFNEQIQLYRAVPLYSGDEKIRHIVVYVENITERREDQQFIESMINLSPDIVYTYDLQAGRSTYVNEGISTVLGYSQKEVLDRCETVVKDLMHPEDFDEYVLKTIPKYSALKEREFLVHEYRMKHRDGNWRRLHSREMVYSRSEAGEVKEIFGVISDITEQWKQKEKIKKINERYTTMFETHDAVLLLIEPDSGKIINANRAAAGFYGYTREELMSMSIDDINTMSPREIAKERQRALKRKANFFIFQHRLKNGEFRRVEVHSTPLEQDENTYLYSIIHDVTEREEAKEELVALKDELESRVKAQTAELNEKVDHLQRFVDATVGRELRMEELVKENEELKGELKKRKG